MNAPAAPVRKVLLGVLGSPSQAVLATAAVRDLHAEFPGRFATDVYSTAPEIWEHNPLITKLRWRVEPITGPRDLLGPGETAVPGTELKIVKEDPGIEVIFLQQSGDYASSISRSNRGAYHAIHSYVHDMGRRLGVEYEIKTFRGDIYLSSLEQSWMSQLEELGMKESFWIILTGGNRDLPVRRWPVEWYQQVVDAFRERITFVQVGANGDGHQHLRGVVDLVGKTNLRQLIRLVYHSCGVLGPPSLLMHLAAAVPVRPFDNERRRNPQCRQCVVIAGGREPWQWYSYSTHQTLHTNGLLACCAQGGCWRSEVRPPRPGELPDDESCVLPVRMGPDMYIPKCLQLITPEMVINRVKIPYDGGALWYNTPKKKQ